MSEINEMAFELANKYEIGYAESMAVVDLTLDGMDELEALELVCGMECALYI